MTAGKHLRLSIFGESHGAAIGGVIEGMPAGEALDLEQIAAEMARRAPGRDPAATQRKEDDIPRILSGFHQGYTTGAPLGFIIENTNTRSQDYAGLDVKPRPSHADYTAHMKYGGFADMRGGGHFSGRLTAPLVFAGAVAKQILSRRGVTVGGHILSAGTVRDGSFDPCNISAELLEKLAAMRFPVLEPCAEDSMRAEIENARMDTDSLGGVCEIAAVGLPVGIGGPLFDGVEGTLSALLFGIPAVKGVEFGGGFPMAELRASQANDPFYSQQGTVKTRSNYSGGIQGGITNGMPLLCRVAFKPTPSIASPQETVNLSDGTPVRLEIKGRHDPFIALRGLVAAESALAIGLLDLLLSQ